MTESAATTSVRRQVVVQASMAEAFQAFTERFGDFKPREHNLLRAPVATTVFEPPARLVFSWDINPQWQLETNPAFTSEVEVRFFAETPARTRVELEHRNLDRHGSGWESIRGGVDSDGGWPLYLQRFAALFTMTASDS